MAILAPDRGEGAFGARHLASSMGIPAVFTHDLDEALRQPMVIICGSIAGDFMTAAVTQRLHDYIAAGGVVLADDAESAGIQQLAGITAQTAAHSRYAMTFDVASGDPGLRGLTHAEERTISLGNRKEATTVLTQTFKLASADSARVLARFDDGSPALVEHAIGKGRIYVSGLALYDAVLRPQTDHALDAGRVYDNGFEPSADVPQMIVRDWYLHLVAGAVVTDTTPDGLSGALIVTHDVDYSQSVLNMVPYARAEQSNGIHATYFVQAKTVKDAEDLAFFDARACRIVRQAGQEGADIASHTVAHAPDFRTFPAGTGRETAANYAPRVVAIAPDHRGGLTLGASVDGEVGVSKARLDACDGAARVDALRTGYLLINPAQWAALERYGYRFDSSYAAGELMTALPYTVMEDPDATVESSIIEFPIAIADAQGWTPMMDHITALERVLDDESDIHAVATTLIHPDVVKDKLDAELALVRHARPRMWVGSIDAFGDFWERRADTVVTGSPPHAGVEAVSVFARRGVDGLTLDVGAPIRSATVVGTTARVSPGGAVVLGSIAPGQTVTVSLTLKQSE